MPALLCKVCPNSSHPAPASSSGPVAAVTCVVTNTISCKQLTKPSSSPQSWHMLSSAPCAVASVPSMLQTFDGIMLASGYSTVPVTVQ